MYAFTHRRFPFLLVSAGLAMLVQSLRVVRPSAQVVTSFPLRLGSASRLMVQTYRWVYPV